MKITLVTLCYNEEDIIPFAIEYWKKIISDGIELSVIVYDNESTDNSVKMLEEFSFVEIRTYKSDGCDDRLLIEIKNNAWKGTYCDWVIACDMDELVYAPNLKESLKRNNADVILPKWYIGASTEFPRYIPNVLLHTQMPMWKKFNNGNKALIFNPKTINDINYGIGCHTCSPIRYDGEKPIISNEDSDIYCFHIDKRLSEDYFVEQMKERDKRRSDINRKYGYGSHYSLSENVHRENYRKIVSESVNILDVIKNNGEA